MSKITFNSKNPKVKQFAEELNALLTKFQFKLDATITMDSKGIYAMLDLKPLEVINAKT